MPLRSKALWLSKLEPPQSKSKFGGNRPHKLKDRWMKQINLSWQGQLFKVFAPQQESWQRQLNCRTDYCEALYFMHFMQGLGNHYKVCKSSTYYLYNKLFQCHFLICIILTGFLVIGWAYIKGCVNLERLSLSIYNLSHLFRTSGSRLSIKSYNGTKAEGKKETQS